MAGCGRVRRAGAAEPDRAPSPDLPDPSKSDSIDALAAARAALTEPDLPAARHDPASKDLKLLVDHRVHLVAERTCLLNRLRWHVHQLRPELDLPLLSLHRKPAPSRVRQALETADAGLQNVFHRRH
ncbi:transposase [Streptomyces sp. NPDC052000]|uniref:IS110 family transposase n=1 Tax=Streptomyces sp. NPDC052000 TaxID=3155676 RepID=UPI00344BD4ED